ncbi:CRISPR type AFERR-associated protein Csf2 [Thiorhodovibrio winogradskyi]|uniref:CRISPR type AFERR-associated protein Csf2 n=1 Tax=Thiorhodovibrio winogradskyi TaxID=77007 RepID=A0ABZ0SEP7_9GAMM|nr:type IV CRISPR-associated protein Csf2 [Thiorhodovibrio winogradskyi]
MSDFQSLTIDGLFTLQSPLHISDPRRDCRYDAKTHRIVYRQNVGFPLTRTRTMSFFMPGLSADDDQGRSGVLTVPVLPAAGLRGRLRRAGAKELEDVVVGEHGEQLSMQAYQGLHCGAISGNPRGDPPKLDQVRALLDHVFIGLYGGGARLTPSRLEVATGVPLIHELMELDVIPPEYASQAIVASDAWRLTTVLPIVRNDDLLSLRDLRAEGVIADFATVMEEQFVAETARRKQRVKGTEDAGQEAEAATARGLRAMSAVEAVLPGVSFYVCFHLSRGTFAQGGLLIASLLQLLRQSSGGLGGKQAVGFGKFTHRLRITVDGQRGEPFSGRGAGTQINVDMPLICQMTDAADAALMAIRAQPLHQLIMGEAS